MQIQYAALAIALAALADVLTTGQHWSTQQDTAREHADKDPMLQEVLMS